MRKARYSSFDTREGKAFERGKLSLVDLAKMAGRKEVPLQSGRQELYENIINQYL